MPNAHFQYKIGRPIVLDVQFVTSFRWHADYFTTNKCMNRIHCKPSPHLQELSGSAWWSIASIPMHMHAWMNRQQINNLNRRRALKIKSRVSMHDDRLICRLSSIMSWPYLEGRRRMWRYSIVCMQRGRSVAWPEPVHCGFSACMSPRDTRPIAATPSPYRAIRRVLLMLSLGGY